MSVNVMTIVQLTRYLPISIPQRGEKHHQDHSELKNLNLVEDANALVVLEGLDSLLQVVGDLRQLLHSSNAFHKYSVLKINQ